MSINLTNIIQTTLATMLTEQQEANPSTAVDVFTEPQQKFLSSFAKAGSQHIGVIYSVSDIGIREFVARSGAQYNCTPAVLLSLIRGKHIKIVPYTGYGRNTDYTLELRLPLDAVEKYKDKFSDKKPSADASGTDMEGAEPLPTGLDLAHVIKYGDLLKESTKIAKHLINKSLNEKEGVPHFTKDGKEWKGKVHKMPDGSLMSGNPHDKNGSGPNGESEKLYHNEDLNESSKNKKKSSKENEIEIHLDKSRILSRVPKDFIYHLKRVITMLRRKTYSANDQERLIADILDNLQLNFDLSDKQMRLSFEYHRNQKRLQNLLNKK